MRRPDSKDERGRFLLRMCHVRGDARGCEWSTQEAGLGCGAAGGPAIRGFVFSGSPGVETCVLLGA